MKTCEWCGKQFDWFEEEDSFIFEFPRLSYENVAKCLCSNCAIQAINDGVEGVYFETCEKCGAHFDLIEEAAKFNDHFPWYNGTHLTDHWDREIICCDCALDDIRNMRP